MKKLLSLLLAVIAMAELVSCSSNGCEETRETFCFIDMKNQDKNTKLNSLQVWYNDTLASSHTAPTSVELVLPPDSSHIQYRFDMTVKKGDEEYQVSDTLDIHYEAFPYFLDMECGCSLFFSLNKVSATQHFWQSVDLINKDITNEESVNLRIVY